MANKLYAVFLIFACALLPFAAVADHDGIPEFTGGCGDVNGDGNVQVQDIILTVQLLLNGEYSLQADVNNDHNINVQDILKMVDWLLNPSTPDKPSCHGCTMEDACNYDKAKTVLLEGSCVYPEEFYNCDGSCASDADGDGICDGMEVPACMDAEACNYEPTATLACADCCVLPGIYQCPPNEHLCRNDNDGDEVCDEDEIDGCTDENSCNHDPSATDDDGSCWYPAKGDGYECDDSCTVDTDEDGVCDQFEIEGCDYPTACNYDVDVTDNDNSCVFAENFKDCDGNCLSDPDGDGICTEYEHDGCTYPTACNYDPHATDDDNTCVFAKTHFDCTGACLSDKDGDGTCDGEEVLGCQDSTSCNYDSAATEGEFETYCTYPKSLHYDCFEACIDDVDDDGVCDGLEIDGCMDSAACNHDETATDDDDSCSYEPHGALRDCHGACFVDTDEDNVCNDDEVAGCLDPDSCEPDIVDGLATNGVTDHDLSLCIYPTHVNLDCSGGCIKDEDDNGVCDHLEVIGCLDDTACNFNAQIGVTRDDDSCTYALLHRTCTGYCNTDTDKDNVCEEDEIEGCMNEEACNYDPTATDHDADGCVWPARQEVHCDGSCITDTDGDEVCDDDEIFGCTNPEACTYDETATENVEEQCEYPPPRYACTGRCAEGFKPDCSDDGDCCSEAWLLDDYSDCKDQQWGCDLSCYEEEAANCHVVGCMDDTACTYDWLATENDDSMCEHAETHYDCLGKCLEDTDHDDVCDGLEVEGCMDIGACNYNGEATDNIGCVYRQVHYDCDGFCINDEDGDLVCDENEISDCKRPDACNYEPLATDDDGSCTYATEHYDCDGFCLADTDGDLVCDPNEVEGCRDPHACNFNQLATDDVFDADSVDNCWYPELYKDCEGLCLNDGTNDEDGEGNGVCDEVEIVGCENPNACNYDLYVTKSDPASCVMPQQYLDCDLNCLIDTDGDGVCDELEIEGCRHDGACNFNTDATDDFPADGKDQCSFPVPHYDCNDVCLSDVDGDLVCDENEIKGCQEADGCNYKEDATDDDPDFPCTFAETFYDCEGNCLYDEDHDHICDQFEVQGCRDDSGGACNFNPDATDDAPPGHEHACWYPEYGFNCEGICADGYVDDCSTNGKCCDAAWKDDGICDHGKGTVGCDLTCYSDEAADCSGCIDPLGCDFDDQKVFGTQADCKYPTSEFHTCHDRCKTDYLPDCKDSERCCHSRFLGDGMCHSGQALADQDECDFSCYDFDGGDCVGCMDEDGSNYPDFNWPDEATQLAETRGGCNFDATMKSEALSPHPRTCVYPEPYYKCDGTCRKDEDGDGVCDELEIYGCLDAEGVDNPVEPNEGRGACNLHATATEARNEDCAYPEVHYDCAGECLNDLDGDGVCNEIEVMGCKDGEGKYNTAEQYKQPCNFNADATDDDGFQCEYPHQKHGELYLDCDGTCTNDYNTNNVCDEEEVFGCMDDGGLENPKEPDMGRGACNFDSLATAPYTAESGLVCEYPEPHYDCWGRCVADADNDKVCDGLEIPGCMNPKACNYVEEATDPYFPADPSDGDDPLLCQLPAATKDCEGNCADGFVRDCSVDGVCCLASFIGDAVADCFDRKWDCDLSCYDYDGGKCIKHGCGDETACNYDVMVTHDDLSCKYAPDYYNCDSECLIDTDGDGVCEELEVIGCQDSIACNYNPLATDGVDDDICYYNTDEVHMEYPDGLHDCDGDCIDDADGDTVCDTQEQPGCTDPDACNYELTATDDDDSCVYATEHYRCCVEKQWTPCDDSTNEKFCRDAGTFHPLRHCCNEAHVDVCATTDDFKATDSATDPVTGDVLEFSCQVDDDKDDTCDDLESYGCLDADGLDNPTEPLLGIGACNDQSDDPSVTEHNKADCWYPHNWRDCDGKCRDDTDDDDVCAEDEVNGCTDVTACNFDEDATEDDGSCVVRVQYKDCFGACVHDKDADGECDEEEVPGCTDETACNYAEEIARGATLLQMSACERPELGKKCDGTCASDADGDGTCDDLEVPGCTDVAACNYDSDATELDVTACNFPKIYLDCDDNCLDDEDTDGVCDQHEVRGCTDGSSCNPDADATDDDGSCSYPATHYDCFKVCLSDTDGDGVCDDLEIEGCRDSTACNYDATATDDDVCTYPDETYLDCKGDCLNDEDGDDVCTEIEVHGCASSDACNYGGIIITESDGSCTFAEEYYDCDDNCLEDEDGDEVCDVFEVVGCQKTDACNYDASATDAFDEATRPDGTVGDDEAAVGCMFAVDLYDCDGNCLYDANYDGLCDHLEVPGCNLKVACNYDDRATQFNGACTFAAVHRDCDGNCLQDHDGDLVCDENEIRGCKQENACNPDPLATDDDGSCTFAEAYYDCDHNCLEDEDGDEVCDVFEVVGCQKRDACNYDASATDAFDETTRPDGTVADDEAAVGCTYPEQNYWDCEGDCLSDADNDGVCEEVEIYGCKDIENPKVCNFDDGATEHDPAQCTYSPLHYDCDGACEKDTDEDGTCDDLEIYGCTDDTACNYDSTATEDEGCVYVPSNGHYKCDPNGYHCAEDVCFSCIDDVDGDEVCDPAEVLGCQDETACNYNAAATDESGECRYASVAHRDCSNDCISDTDDDGVCDEDEVFGCTKMNACNYAPDATEPETDENAPGYCRMAAPWRNCHGVCLSDVDLDGVCDGEEVEGCKEPTACNIDHDATDAGDPASFCEFPEQYYNCDGCINDTDDDDVCDENEVDGCDDEEACNYDAAATEDDGSCTYPPEFKTCDDECMPGYIPDCSADRCCAESWLGPKYKDCKDRAYGCDLSCHDYDGGACVKYGCNRESACNYDYLVTHQEPNSCIWPEEHRHCDGSCINDDNANGVCDELEFGCKDQAACNFNEEAINHVASNCIYAEEHYTCDGVCVNDVDADGVCDDLEVFGCDDIDACDFDSSATESDGSCQYPDDYKTCLGYCINDGDFDGICDEDEVYGCSRPSACNYDTSGTVTEIDNTLCEYALPHRKCDGSCDIDTDGDGVCNEEEIEGCGDEAACNYDDAVTEPTNDVCSYGSWCKGCTDPAACNFNELALPRFDTQGECKPLIDNRLCADDGDYGDCESGYLSDCSGNNKCVREEYLGDNYADCGANGGWDLSCYPEENCP